MTITIGVSKARAHWSSLLESLAAGEEVVLTKRGRPVARMLSAQVHEREALAAAIAGLKALRDQSSLGGLDWKALRDEGRR